ncbi:MAG: acriflavin resistance protein, partial [Chloroflexota bacterium]
MRQVNWSWLGVLPFFIFAVAFMLWPATSLFWGSFLDGEGHFTLQNIRDLFQPFILNAYWLSIQISAV